MRPVYLYLVGAALFAVATAVLVSTSLWFALLLVPALACVFLAGVELTKNSEGRA